MLASIPTDKEDITLKPEKYYQIITGEDDGRKAWWLLEIDQIKKPLLKKMHLQQDICLSDYGTVMASGFGVPPEKLGAMLKDLDNRV